ncbi:helix-turn-helix domain-containing protein [Streptomyces sp. ID05-18]|uniref:helix-turn-helix domain-containing protein n=1 Tax=Streptomyces sp. ID05-18 TaxID=3028662 RepID=UPI0029B0EE71|nr:helix-turn-helix domain-containing protein [Streptomyces sp. ID05-18]MDX3490978.1 helix-turn-helix domain-containing protein [Streptomyces sp. ID05-18]
MKRPMLTQREAATACGVSRTTIRRRREAGGLPGAVQDESRGWLIPVEDLLAAGFRLNAPAGPAADSAAGAGGHHQEHGHGQGDDAVALRTELTPAPCGRQLGARVEIVEHLQRALAVACSPGFTAVPA